MDPARWQQIERLYHAALARPAADRASFLVEACAGDESLRREVEELLDTPRTADGVFAAPAVARAAGETISDTIAAILGRQPDWTALPATVPSVVRSLLERCLDKEPKRRVRNIGDVGLYLDSTHADRSQPLGVVTSPGRRGYLWRAGAAVGLLAAGVGGGALWKGGSGTTIRPRCGTGDTTDV